MFVDLYINSAFFIEIGLSIKSPFGARLKRKRKILYMLPVLYSIAFIYEFFVGVYFVKMNTDEKIFIIGMTLFPVPVLLTIWATYRLV